MVGTVGWALHLVWLEIWLGYIGMEIWLDWAGDLFGLDVWFCWMLGDLVGLGWISGLVIRLNLAGLG